MSRSSKQACVRAEQFHLLLFSALINFIEGCFFPVTRFDLLCAWEGRCLEAELSTHYFIDAFQTNVRGCKGISIFKPFPLPTFFFKLLQRYTCTRLYDYRLFKYFSVLENTF